MATTEGAKIGHTTSQLFSFSSHYNHQKDCAGQWLGQTRVDYVCVYECSHCTDVSMRCVCWCVCCINLCVLSVLQHPGAVEYQWRSLGLCLWPDHCAEEWKDKEEVKSMASEDWLAGWLAGNSKLHLHNK